MRCSYYYSEIKRF